MGWEIIRPDAVIVWKDEEVRRRLSWYYSVMKGWKPAKFIIARSLQLDNYSSREELSEAEEQDLWKHHEKTQEEFNKIWREIKEDDKPGNLAYTGTVEPSFLDLKIELVKRLATPCRLCERRCLIDRTKRIGACRLKYETYVHSAFLHMGEEAPLVPSGTIFYGGCNFTCVFCQNYDISQVAPRLGKIVSPVELAYMQDILAKKGARNINHVGGDPTPSAHTIIESMRYVRSNIPQLWNSNMYMTLETLMLLVDLIDIWLPDLKYGNNKCAFRLSAVKNYWEVVTRNLKIAAAHGDMIIRHLVLPGHTECCSLPIMEWISKNLPKDKILVNIMEQYTPMHLVKRTPHRWPEISRRPKIIEIGEVRRAATRLGILWEPVS
ncbi:MAG: radical SAM protein [Desulfurococcales archaeon]|nr:radical SAM protein [Desulfurococcales archaeon]